MADLGQMSNEDLLRLVSEQPDDSLAALSNEELLKLAGPGPTQMIPGALKGNPNPDPGMGHTIRLLGSGLVRGIPNVGMTAAQLALMANQGPFDPRFTEEMKADMLSRMQQGQQEFNQIGEQAIPGSGLDVVTQAVGEGASTGLLGPGRFIPNLATGAISAIGSQTAMNANPLPGMDPVAGLVGGLAGGWGANALANGLRQQFGRGTAPQLARELLENTNPAERQLAESELANFRGAGYTPLVGQGFEGNPRMDYVSRVLAETGRNTPRVLSNQVRQGRAGFDRLRQGLGPADDPQAVANNAQIVLAAQKDAAIARRTAAYEREIAPVANTRVPNSTVTRLVARLSLLARSNDGFKGREIGDQLTRTAARIEQGLANGPYTLNSLAKALKEAKDNTAAALNESTGLSSGGRNRAAALIDQEYERLVGQTVPGGRAFVRADIRYQLDSQRINDTFNKSVAGKIIGKGVDPGKEASREQLFKVFRAGTDPDARLGARSRIRQLARLMNRTNPGLYRQAVATDVSGLINKHLDEVPSVEGLRNAANALYGPRTQAQGFRDQMAGIDEGAGLPIGTTERGFRNFLESTIKLTGWQPSPIGKIVGEVDRAATGPTPASRAVSSVRFGDIKGGLDRIYSEKAFRQIDALWTRPDGLKLLQDLARMQPESAASRQMVIKYLLGAMAANEGQTE